MSNSFNQHQQHRCMMNLSRFVITTILIIIANAASSSSSSSSSIHTASIFANYNKYHRRTDSSSIASSYRANSANELKSDLNLINLWNCRSLSSLQLSAHPPAAATSTPTSPSLGHVDSVSTSSFRRGRGRHDRRRRGIPTTQNGEREYIRNAIDNDDENKNALFTNQYASSSSKRKKNNNKENIINDQEYQNQHQHQPTVAQMRSHLGPIGLLVANAVEVGVATAGSYMSGGCFGYIVGGVTGVPLLFQNSQNLRPPGSAGAGLNMNNIPPLPPVKGMREIQRRIGGLNSKAFTQGKSWATLSASFSGFHALTRVCRGGVEDRWNSIIGSAMAGAYMSREAGPQAMLNAASTYAGFTYIIDRVFGSATQPNTGLDNGFEFTDAPIEDRGY